MFKKILERIRTFFERRKIRRQLDDIEKTLEVELKERARKTNEVNDRIIQYGRKRIKTNYSRYIRPKKISRNHLITECRSKFREELKGCDAVLTPRFKVKYKKIK